MAASEPTGGDLQSQSPDNDIEGHDESRNIEDHDGQDQNERLLQQDIAISTGQETVQPAIRFHLCISHILSTFNSRVFEFGAVLYLASIFPSTLLPLSVYAIFRSALAIIFGPIIGRWIDHGERLKIVRASIVGGRLAVMVSCILFWILEGRFLDQPWTKWALLSLLIPLGCAEKVYGTVNMVAVERDWVSRNWRLVRSG